jgi:membrane-bound metal-dependent hydrolase YbcI (DUF457 family)
MPNYSTHAQTGAMVGALAAVYRARSAPTDQMVAETVGGLLGGWLGGILPDVLEPARDPNHRKLAHSLAAGGALTLARIAEWQAGCRTAADAATSRSLMHPMGSSERSSAEWDAFFWRLLAGALVGLVAGYASHLALDAGTPRGLPLLGA